MIYKNSKLPESPATDTKDNDKVEIDEKYYYVSGESTLNGGFHYRFEDPENFEGSYQVSFHPSTGFEINRNSTEENGGVRYALDHHVRGLASGGTSQHSNGPDDGSTSSNKRLNVKTDDGGSVGGDKYRGSGGLMLAAYGGGEVTERKQGQGVYLTDGDIYNEYIGNIHSNHEGDTIDTITGNKHVIVASSQSNGGTGQYGIHVQDGNMDMQVDKGKFRIKTIGDTLYVMSDVKIVFNVGTSTITMESGQITVQASAVKFEKA